VLLGETQAFASPEEALVHYGKKGMKWGVRNEDVSRDAGGRIVPKPVAPLSEKKQARVEKFVKRSETMNTKISDLKAANEGLQGTRNPAQLYQRRANNETIRDLQKAQQRALRDAEATKQGRLTSTQKRLIVGAVGVTAVVGVGLVLRGQQSGAINSYMLRGEAFVQGRNTPFKVNKSLSGKMSAKDLLANVARPVNPNYKSAGGQMNCRRSTFAYELRRRGLDVHATTSPVGWGQSESGVINALTTEGKDIFRSTSLSETVAKTGATQKARGDTRINPVKKIVLDGLKRSPAEESKALTRALSKLGPNDDIMATINKHGYQSSSKKVLEELAKQGNGARGEVVFRFDNFGHSMAYEVVDGVPHIFDSQKGTLYNAAGKMVESKWDGFHGAEITRLDNVDLDLNFLSRWATNN
jgi:hypothetical protein